MRFGYYDRLTPAQRRVYRQSDAITSLRLPGAAALREAVGALAEALECEDRATVQAAAQGLFSALTRGFGVPPCRVEVLSARPHGRWGELQGLYTTRQGARPAKVQLWMRTARQRRVVAFRTFLRTLLHELGHHLDYEHLRLADSFHTEGFYKRESSVFNQLVPALDPPRGENPNREPSAGGQLVPALDPSRGESPEREPSAGGQPLPAPAPPRGPTLGGAASDGESPAPDRSSH